MSIAQVESSNAASAGTIIHLLSPTGFAADTGKRARPMNDKSPEFGDIMQDILTAMNKFLADHPKNRPSDYFRGLGMSCGPAAASASVSATRCEIEVPIYVQCFSTNELKPWGSPLPDELQKPLPARLRLQADVSRTALLDVNVRVLPVPGGRLCHR